MRCCDGNFLLAKTEVVMTTLRSSHVKDKNCIFTEYEILVTGKILVFHRYLCNIREIAMLPTMRRCRADALSPVGHDPLGCLFQHRSGRHFLLLSLNKPAGRWYFRASKPDFPASFGDDLPFCCSGWPPDFTLPISFLPIRNNDWSVIR